jgi:hypothetical protein
MRCRVINAVEVGGAINQERLLVARVHAFWNHLWTWGDLEAGEEVTRPMSNLLTPPGLVPRHLYDHRSQRVVPDAQVDPMPCYIGAWIQTEKGVRRLMPEETS